MTIHNLYIFDRHCTCISFTSWTRPTAPPPSATPTSSSLSTDNQSQSQHQAMQQLGATGMSLEEEAKLVYGVVFSLRNMLGKLNNQSQAGPGGQQNGDGFIGYRTSTYRLHYFETPTGLKFVMNTDPTMDTMREALRTIYAQIYVEYVTRNPLLEQLRQKGVHPVHNDLFKGQLQRYVRSLPGFE
ncbi:Trafficking protein particle complex subunit 1 [Thoreauomyces humboldtii]|nr:Trafficking protein particle complex subunit 1 [Thoreauomyces humboldtii]